MFLSRVGGSFKTHSKYSSVETDAAIAKLKSALSMILRSETSPLSFEEIYTNGYDLVIHRQGEKLYECVKSCIQEFLKAQKEVLDQFSSTRELAVRLSSNWDQFAESMRIVCDVLMYLDRNYLAQYKKPGLLSVGYRGFQDGLLTPTPILQRAVDFFIAEVNEYRRGVGDLKLVSPLMSIFLKTSSGQGCRDILNETLVPELIKSTTSFYCQLSDSLFSQGDLSNYTRIALKALVLEEEWLCSPSTGTKQVHSAILPCLHSSLIDRHSDELMVRFFDKLVMEGNHSDLKAVYQLFSRTSKGRKCMLFQFRNSMTQQLSNSEKIEIANIVEKLRGFQELIKTTGLGKEFLIELESASESIFSKSFDICLRLSLYVEEAIKRPDSIDLDKRLSDGMVVFKYITSKDVFEAYYRMHLGKRLLGSSIDLETEQKCLLKFKQECGQQYVAKLEAMLTDIVASQELMSQWRQQSNDVVESSFKILSTSAWSNLQLFPAEPNLPLPLRTSVKTFNEFYTTRFAGKKLTWVWSQGTVDVTHTKAGCLLTVSTIQACILDLFNSSELLTLDSILKRLNVQFKDLRRHILSLLVNPKCRILRKSVEDGGDSALSTLNPSDTFLVNELFVPSGRHVRVPLIVEHASNVPELTTGPTDTDTGAGIEQVIQEDRKHLIEAAIVRTMKSKRQIQHQDLISELTKQLGGRFIPSPQVIKERVENLIDREYLARDNDDVKQYYYVA